MRRILPLILLSLTLTSCTVSKRTAFLTIPEAPAAAEQIDLGLYEDKYGDYDGVYLYSEEIVEHAGGKENLGLFANELTSNKWTYSMITKEKYIVFDPDAAYLTSSEFGGKPDVFYARLTSPDGTVRTFLLSDLETTAGTYGDRFTLVYPDVEKGTLVERGWEYSFGGGPWTPLDYYEPLQYVWPCERLSYTFLYPEWWTIEVKNIGPHNTLSYAHERLAEGKKKILKYEATDVSAYAGEPFSPAFKEVSKYLQFRIANLQMSLGRLENPDNWADFVKNIRKGMLKKMSKRSKKVESLTDDITARCATPYQKLDTIVSHVQQNIKLAPEEDHDGHPDKTLTKMNGNTVDIISLTRAMLAHAGISSDILLVHSADDGHFDRNYVDFAQFSTLALGVTLAEEGAEKRYTVFPYLEYLPVNHTPEPFQGQEALIVSDALQYFCQTPPGNAANNVSSERYDLAIGPDGLINVRESRTLRGSNAYWIRAAMRDLDEGDTRDFIDSSLTYTDGDVALDSFTVVNLESYRDPLEVELYYTIDNLVTVTPEEVVFQTGGLFSPISGWTYKLDTEKRRNPIKINFDQTYAKEIAISYPEGWTIAGDLPGVELSNEFGSIKAEYAPERGGLRATQEASLIQQLQPKEKIGDLAELIGGRSKLNIPAIVFTVGAAAEIGDESLEQE